MPSPKKCASKFKKGSKGYKDCISYARASKSAKAYAGVSEKSERSAYSKMRKKKSG